MYTCIHISKYICTCIYIYIYIYTDKSLAQEGQNQMHIDFLFIQKEAT